MNGVCAMPIPAPSRCGAALWAQHANGQRTIPPTILTCHPCSPCPAECASPQKKKERGVGLQTIIEEFGSRGRGFYETGGQLPPSRLERGGSGLEDGWGPENAAFPRSVQAVEGIADNTV
uniref:Uncharacterized protein n=1 Tax=Eutreptiella gymnastica TaxID=73025 RepID=A0A7S1J607_9EUGL